MATSQAVVVKRTFIEILQDDPTMLEPDFLPLRSRVRSDPELYFKGLDEDNEAETDIESIVAGLSSDSSDVESLRVLPSVGTSGGSDATDGLKDTEEIGCTPAKDKKAAHGKTSPLLLSEDSQESGGSPALGDSPSSFDSLVASLLAESEADSPWKGLASLLRENGRLALENKLLRERARLEAENAALRKELPDDEELPVCGKASQPESACAVQREPQPAMPPGTWLVPAASTGCDASMFGCCTKAQDAGNKVDVPPEEGETRTTLMLRNVPSTYTRAMLLELLDEKGFDEKYDFIYLPIDFRTQACLGYAFVNLTSSSFTPEFWKTFSGFADWQMPSKKVCRVTWSDPHQGRDEHVERYRNSPVMHASVPDHYKPAVFQDGERQPFPAPTKPPKAPRSRNFAGTKAQEIPIVEQDGGK